MMSALAPELVHSGRVPLVTVVVTEALDAAAVPVLRDLLGEALALRPERLIVDLAGCPHIDSAAAAVLLEAHREAARSGGELAMRELPARQRGNAELADLAHEQHFTGLTALPSDWWAAVWAGAVAPPFHAGTRRPAGQRSGLLRSRGRAYRESTTTEMGQVGQ